MNQSLRSRGSMYAEGQEFHAWSLALALIGDITGLLPRHSVTYVPDAGLTVDPVVLSDGFAKLGITLPDANASAAELSRLGAIFLE